MSDRVRKNQYKYGTGKTIGQVEEEAKKNTSGSSSNSSVKEARTKRNNAEEDLTLSNNVARQKNPKIGDGAKDALAISRKYNTGTREELDAALKKEGRTYKTEHLEAEKVGEETMLDKILKVRAHDKTVHDTKKTYGDNSYEPSPLQKEYEPMIKNIQKDIKKKSQYKGVPINQTARLLQLRR